MTDQKPVVSMSDRKFMKAKLSGKSTAEGFIAAHRAFIESHSFLAPILEAYDDKDMLPTPSLQAMQAAVFDHVMEAELKTAQKKIEKSIAKSGEKIGKSGTMIIRRDENGEIEKKIFIPSGNYTVTLMVNEYDRSGTVKGVGVGTIEKVKTRKAEKDGKEIIEEYIVIEPAIYEAKDYGSAERLADRRLFSREDSVYAIIENVNGKKISTNVLRGDSIARILRSKKGPASRNTSSGSSSLKWVGKAKNDTCRFSGG